MSSPKTITLANIVVIDSDVELRAAIQDYATQESISEDLAAMQVLGHAGMYFHQRYAPLCEALKLYHPHYGRPEGVTPPKRTKK